MCPNRSTNRETDNAAFGTTIVATIFASFQFSNRATVLETFIEAHVAAIKLSIYATHNATIETTARVSLCDSHNSTIR